MRATVTLADDVVAGVEQRRIESGQELSEVVNDLLRAGMATRSAGGGFRQRSHNLGRSVDFSNIGEVVESLEDSTTG